MSKRKFQIVILEDNEFFNRLLTRNIQNFTEELGHDKNCEFEIQSFTNARDCLANIKPETDLAFIDYYLDSTTALELLGKLKEKCEKCKIIIISQIDNLKTAYQTILEGAYEFIKKDQMALPRTNDIIEDLVSAKL
jgi:DNA-binding NtrC family response regulator